MKELDLTSIPDVVNAIAEHVSPTVGNIIAAIEESRPQKGEDIAESCGEIGINGITYQIQVHLVSNEAIWIGQDETRIATQKVLID